LDWELAELAKARRSVATLLAQLYETAELAVASYVYSYPLPDIFSFILVF